MPVPSPQPLLARYYPMGYDMDGKILTSHGDTGKKTLAACDAPFTPSLNYNLRPRSIAVLLHSADA